MSLLSTYVTIYICHFQMHVNVTIISPVFSLILGTFHVHPDMFLYLSKVIHILNKIKELTLS